MNSLALSLFAGAGGMDIGVGAAGFKTACAIELDPHCTSTLRRNARGKTIWQVDIRALDASRVAETLGLSPGQLCLLHGGPPCQPFSQIGKQGGVTDPQGPLVFEFVRFAEALRPKAIMIEQVPRFLNATYSPREQIVDVLSDRFRTVGYDLHAEVLNAVDHGVPQRRKRAIIICVPSGQSYHFPAASLLQQPPEAGEAIADLPPAVPPCDEPLAPNHIDVTPTRDRQRISDVREGEWLAKSRAPADILMRLTAKDTTKFRRLHRRLPSLTLRCGEILYHPTEDRYLTPRESARIQGFPDNHVFVGPIRRRTGQAPDLDQHRQVANAVAEAVADSVRAALCL